MRILILALLMLSFSIQAEDSASDTKSLAPTVPNDFEFIPESEPAEMKKLLETTKAAMAPRQGRPANPHRDAHPKEHGCVDDVEVYINKDLPKHLAHGFFKPNAEYKGIIRYSAGSSSRVASDLEAGGQGFALKILLPGEGKGKYKGQENLQSKILPVKGETYFRDKKYYKTFDIVTISRVEAMPVPQITDYMAFLGASGASTAIGVKAKMEIAKLDPITDLAKIKAIQKEAAQKVQQVMGRYVASLKNPIDQKRVGQILATLASSKTKNLLAETYSSWVPSLLGANQAVKYQLTPCESVDPDAYDVVAEIGQEKARQNDFLRTVLAHELNKGPSCFKLNVLVHDKDMIAKSIEDTTAPWKFEDKERVFQEVAEIIIPQKEKGNEFVNDGLCEMVSFHPGHASIEHYPIGAIQRARVGHGENEGIYTAISRIRNLNQGHKPRN